MPTVSASHQGTLRGSVELPIETESEGEMGYKTALSELECDGASDATDPPPKYTHPQPDCESRDEAEDDIEVEELPDESDGESAKGPKHGLRKKTPKDSPAYVAPIGKIPNIPSVQPLRSNAQPTPPPEDNASPPKKTPVHKIQKSHLVGKTIDEFGDVVDHDGSVLGRVEGDLPSMIGRTISNARGDVLGDDGELLGYVAEVGSGEEQEASPKQEAPTWSLADIMQTMAAAGKGPGGLRVDPTGNILDPEGNVVGSFHDNVSGFGKKSGVSDENTGAKDSKRRSKERQPKEEPQHQKAEEKAGSSSQSQPRENAQSHRKEDPKESPSDIFLDVKSTTEGIQLTIRIPTVFNSGGQPAQPKVVFS